MFEKFTGPIAVVAAFFSVQVAGQTVEADLAKDLPTKDVIVAAMERGEQPEKILSRLYSAGLKRTDEDARFRSMGYVNTRAIREAALASGIPAAQAESIIARRALRGLCMYVGDREENAEPLIGVDRSYVWAYQKRVFEAAMVDLSQDDREAIRKKISKVWKQNEDELTCNNTRFDVIGGSVIKYAVNMKFDEFILDMAEWNVDLNKVDKFDGRTVLDYVEYQIERMKGTPSETILLNYRRILSDAGAKRSSEL